MTNYSSDDYVVYRLRRAKETITTSLIMMKQLSYVYFLKQSGLWTKCFV